MFLTTKESAAKWNVTETWVSVLCKQGRIPGAIREGRRWMIPENASKPEDARKAKRDVSTARFKFVDLFAGVGGFHQAMRYLGGECVMAAEINQECVKTYKLNFKTSEKEIRGDVKKIDPVSIGPFDVLCAGFPCQPFSKAGAQQGFQDKTRGNLFYTIMDAQQKLLYDELNTILDNYKIPYACRDITARIMKIFCSCCDYHCVELIRSIKDLCVRESPVIKAPILHIVYVLRRSLAKEDLKEIILQDHLIVNWKLEPDVEFEQPEIYLVSLDQEEIKILNILAEQYDVIYAKADFNHYYVRFKTMDAFMAFKKYALELSQPYYVFEGDVEKILRVKREYHNIVELEPLDSFDITNTLAKILGLRNDY